MAGRSGQAAGTRIAANARGSVAPARGLLRGKAASAAVGLVAAAGGQGRVADLVTAGALGASRTASSAGRVVSAATRGGKAAHDWWRSPTHAVADHAMVRASAREQTG